MDSDEKVTNKQLQANLVSLQRRNSDLEAELAECRQSEEALRASETRYRRIFESAIDGILILDAQSGQITDVNPFLTGMLGLSREELLGRRLWEIGLFRSLDSSRSTLNDLGRSGFVHHEDLSLTAKNGRCIEVEFVGKVYWISSRKVVQCNIRDITERKRTEEKLKYLSTHDELTGLHNRMFFDEEISRLSRGRQFPVTVILADVDGLKEINDRVGHTAGDELLRRAAALLKETFRADEVVARMGGDEFVVLLPKTDASTAEMALDRARSRMHSHNQVQAGLALSLSLGAATAKTSQSLVEAMKLADERMYAEKMAHRLERFRLKPRDLELIFKQVDARLTASPGIHITRLSSELACERHVIERAVRVVKSMQFREYQQRRRFETALRLLSEKSMLIKEIAGALGYTSPTSLWRLLRTRIRKSPTDIKALNKRVSVSAATNVELFSTLESPAQLMLNLPKT
jgi:diguanylate cyclase (GGDEF)-like protein/PAS domain S-box-containing protein